MSFNLENEEEYKLNRNWILWEHRKSNKDYSSNTNKIGSFNTIKDFWRHYNNYPYPSMLFYNGKFKPFIKNPNREVSSISLFEENTLPQWEDQRNKFGGEIAYRNFKELKDIDFMWERLSCAIVGEEFELSEFITGIRVVDSSIKNKSSLYRIELWFSDNSKKINIENNFKTILKLNSNIELYYKNHCSAIDTSKTKSRRDYSIKYGRNRK